MNKALDFVCGRIGWPCDLPDYSSNVQNVRSQVQGHYQRAVPEAPEQPVGEQLQLNHYQNEIRSGQPTQSNTMHPSLAYREQIHSQKHQNSSISSQIESQMSALSVKQQQQSTISPLQQPQQQPQQAPPQHQQQSINNNLLAEIRVGANLRPVNGGSNVRSIPTQGSLPVSGNFNDELKRRLAGRQQMNSQMNKTDQQNQLHAEPPQPQQPSPLASGGGHRAGADSSDYSSEPSPDNDKAGHAVVTGTSPQPTEAMRKLIRAELSHFRVELLEQFRAVVRTEIRNLQYDSNH